MKLHDETVSVLKNFAAINKNILIRPGNVIRTVSPSKTVMGKAVVQDEFPTDVCLYELNRFLNTLGLFNNPDIEFKDTHLTIQSGPSSIRYSYANPELLVVAKDKDLEVSDYFDTIHLTSEVLMALDRARKTLALEEVSIESDGENLYVKAIDASGTTDDEFALQLGKADRKFKAVIKSENLELMPSSYDVSISSRGITYWKGSNVEYWIVLVANKSEFE